MPPQAGQLRLRLEHGRGWVSSAAGDGSVLLEEQGVQGLATAGGARPQEGKEGPEPEEGPAPAPAPAPAPEEEAAEEEEEASGGLERYLSQFLARHQHPLNTKGYSSTDLAMGVAHVRAGTRYPPEH